jgi:hypothetical protein
LVNFLPKKFPFGVNQRTFKFSIWVKKFNRYKSLDRWKISQTNSK